MERICGATTLRGTPCRWPAGKCKVHGPRPLRMRPGDAREPESPPARPAPPPAALESRDLRGVAWWLLEEILSDRLQERAGAIASILRVLAALGPGELAEDEALAEVELRGLLMHGLPPKDEAAWERARAVFSPEALAEFARWGETGASVEDDAGDGDEPLRFRQG